jgi:hypothetical protein
MTGFPNPERQKPRVVILTVRLEEAHLPTRSEKPRLDY